MSDIPSMDDTPAAAPAKAGIPSMEGPDTPAPDGQGMALLKSNAQNMLSVADMVGSIPASLVGVAADTVARVHALAKGQGGKAAGQEGNMAYNATMDLYGNPFSRLLHFAGMGNEEEGTPSGVDGVMKKAGKLLEKGGDWVEKNTGGALTKEDVLSLTNEAMALGGGKGMAHGLGKLAAKMPGVTVSGMKTIPEVERAGAYKDAQDRQGSTEEPQPMAPAKMAEGGAIGAQVAAEAKVKLADPKTLVLDPIKGTLTEKIPEIGKELPKSSNLETGLDKAASGRRFDMTAEERIAVKGMEDEPLKQPIIDEQGKILRRGGRFDREGGSIDPKLMARLAAVGLGAWAGAYFSDDQKLEGSILGGMAGLALPGMNAAGRAVSTFKKLMGEDTRIKINDLADAHEKYVQLAAADVIAMQKQIEELVPDKQDRMDITHAIEANNIASLKANQIKAAKIVTDYFTGIGQVASLEGVLSSARDNYVTHLWDWSENKGLFEKWMDKTAGGPGMGAHNRFSEERTIPTIAAGKAAGLKPLTEDISAIVGVYGNSMSRSVANSVFTRALKLEKVPGSHLGLVVKAEDAPHNYKSINNPAMQGLKVHPDIEPSLKMLYETNAPGDAMKVLMGINDTAKKMAVSYSLFHAKALTDAHIAGSSNPFKAIASIPGMVVGPRGIDFGFFKLSQNKYLQELRKGSASSLVQDAAEGGLKYSIDEASTDMDAGNGFYSSMEWLQKEMDKVIPYSGLPVKGMLALSKKLDTFMWPRLHAAMKLMNFAETKARIMENSVRKMKGKGPSLSSEQASRIAASYVNDLYGGLNWRRIAEDSHSYAARRLGQAMLTPGGQRMLGLLQFAPDWTLSTTRAAVKAFTGRPDFIKPTTLAGLHQQYLIRAAIYYMTVGDAINYTMSGHHLWENKDPTVLDMDPKGERHMQWSKHTMEPVHWLTKPAQQGINKLGMIPREVIEQSLGVDYLSAKGKMAPMKGRIQHLAKNFLPISAQQADQGGAATVVSGFAGVPIYGKTSEQKKADKAERDRKKRDDARKKGQR